MAAPDHLRWLEKLSTLPRPARIALVATIHMALFTAAFICAYLVRFDLTLPLAWRASMWQTLPLVLSIKVLVFGVMQMYQGWWRYISLYDVVALFRALVVGSALFTMVNVLLELTPVPRSIYVLDFGLSLVFVGGARGALRLLREALVTRLAPNRDLENILLLGAGDTGETLLREINKNANLPFRAVGFLDDDPHKHGLRIHNVPVLGTLSQLPDLIQKHNVTTALIAMPSATPAQLRRAVDLARGSKIKVKIAPAVESMLDGSASIKQLREVSISDLLGREPVKLDMQSIGRFLQGRTVLITGAGGSIGSELCRQVLRFEPAALIMIERGETPMFFIQRELEAEHGDVLIPYIASICEADRIREIFARHQPDVIFHAAAYKHVPLMEANPCEAVKNNIMGTQVLIDAAIEAEVDAFVLISTDKAVNPTSVMGATKRITELLVQDAQRRQDHKTRFCAVRFGNVLGSNGSVVPIFREQIHRGGPITVTHPEMTRFFMTIPEAAQLVLQAGALGQGGEVFILDMGESVKIADLARDMIRLSGLTEDDIEIVYSGIRPGEKLFEELAIDDDGVDKTRHNKIFVARNEVEGFENLARHHRALIDAAITGQDEQVRHNLKQIIPTYKHPTRPQNVVPITGQHQAAAKRS